MMDQFDVLSKALDILNAEPKEKAKTDVIKLLAQARNAAELAGDESLISITECALIEASRI